MVDERKREQEFEGNFEYFRIISMRAVENLHTSTREPEAERVRLKDFLDQVAEQAERSGDPTFMNKLADYLEGDTQGFKGAGILGLLNNDRLSEERALELIGLRLDAHEFRAERDARHHAQIVAESAALETGMDPRHAQRVGLNAWRPAHAAKSAEIEFDPGRDNDPALIGQVVAAEAYMKRTANSGTTAYEVYEALVISEDNPDGLVPEIDILRNLQSIENGKMPSFDGHLQELATSLRQALDAGIDPDTNIWDALGLPEARLSPISLPDATMERLENAHEVSQQRLAAMRDEPESASYTYSTGIPGPSGP